MVILCIHRPWATAQAMAYALAHSNNKGLVTSVCLLAHNVVLL